MKLTYHMNYTIFIRHYNHIEIVPCKQLPDTLAVQKRNTCPIMICQVIHTR